MGLCVRGCGGSAMVFFVDNGGADVLAGSSLVGTSLRKSSPKLSVSSRFFIEESVPNGLVGSSRIFSSVQSSRLLWTSGSDPAWSSSLYVICMGSGSDPARAA
nr:hypothetical protein [Tanacetum cinerariifolium]